MKKYIKLFVAVLFASVLVLTGCEKNNNSQEQTTTAVQNQVVGKYTLNKMTAEGVTFEKEKLASLGAEINIEFKDDKTVVISQGEQTETGTYDYSKMTVNGEDTAYTYNDGVLTMSVEGTTMEFAKEN